MRSVLRLANAKLINNGRSRLKQLAPDAGFKGEVIDKILPTKAAGWAWEVTPDALGAAAAGVYGYQNLGGMGGAVAAGAEDLALGLGGSFGGRFAGAGIAYGLAKLTGANPNAMRAMVQQGTQMGGLVGGMGLAMFGPRPITDGIRRQQEEEYLNQQALQGHPLLTAGAGNPIWQNLDAAIYGGYQA